MLEFVQILATFLVAITMSLAVAHAAELPGKLRLDKETYLAVQRIYYPGFTVGATAEPAAIVATAVLLFVTRGGPDAWWVLGALVLLLAMHAVYWIVTHPVNSFWLRDQRLTSVSAGFFSFGARKGTAPSPRADDWTALRDRWEYSHVARAALAMLSLLLLLIAVVT
jgi:hypothetical protein